jgi:hypothetical protein
MSTPASFLERASILNTVYEYVEALGSSSANDIELFKHLLVELLPEVGFTSEQLQVLQDRADLISMDLSFKEMQI